MNKRLLFCVETTQQANTDYPYIRSTVDYFYEINRQTVIRPIYMGSKTRFNSRAVQESIKRQSGTAEDTHVIYCIDTDDCDASPDAKTLTNQISDYCRQNHYDFVFFCRNVEDVYHGKTLSDTEKVQVVKRFRTSNQIKTIKVANLTKREYQFHCSNILNILDCYLTRKKTQE